MKKLLIPVIMTVVIIIVLCGLIVGYSVVENYVEQKNKEIKYWTDNSHKFQSERNHLSFENKDLKVEIKELVDYYELGIESYETDIGVWADAAVELQKEINQWKIYTERHKTKELKVIVKSKPTPKIPLLVEVIPQVIPGVVHILCNDMYGPKWGGSGFIISEHLVGTARHVTEGITKFEITLNDGTVLHATRAISSVDHDFSLIWVEESMTNILELGSIKDCKLGQRVFAIGSPYGQINYNSVTFGIISGLGRNYDGLNLSEYDYGWDVAFQTDAPGHPGSSGGPIFTLDGKVRGILVGGFSPSLIIAMPVDLFIKDIEMIELMFLQDEYYHEEAVVYEYNQYNMPIGPGLGE